MSASSPKHENGSIPEPGMVSLDHQVYSKMRITRSYAGKPGIYTRSVNFSPDGTHCITATNNHTLQLFNCVTGKRKKIVPSLKYGCDLAAFASDNLKVLHSSTKVDDTIRFLSLETSVYIRYFKGHSNRVTSITPSPANSTEPQSSGNSSVFGSSSFDKTVRLWDVRSPSSVSCIKILRNSQSFGVSTEFDSTGIVLVVGDGESIDMFDTRMLPASPFLSINIHDSVSEFANKSGPRGSILPSSNLYSLTAVKLNNPLGDCLLACTSENRKYILNSYDGRCCFELFDSNGFSSGVGVGVGNQDKIPKPANQAVEFASFDKRNTCFTPDGNHIFSGGFDGTLRLWDVGSLALKSKNASDHQEALVKPSLFKDTLNSPVYAAGVNAKYCMMMTAGQDVAFWESFS